MIASTNSVVRIQYGMGRAHALPRQLGWTLPARGGRPTSRSSSRSRSGWRSRSIPGLVWSPVSTVRVPRLRGRLRGGGVVHPDQHGRAVLLRRGPRDGAPAWRSYVVPVVAIVILIPVVYTSFYPSPGYPLKWAPWVVDRLAGARRRLPAVRVRTASRRSTSTTRSARPRRGRAAPRRRDEPA